MTPDEVMAAHLAARNTPEFEALRCSQAGIDMAQEDKVAGVFDDTPPTNMVGQYAALYRTAYQKAHAHEEGAVALS